MAKFFQEFREFAVKGNVVDMAVGIIIGGAFTLIVQSLVADVMNPLIGLLVGGVDFSNLFVVLRQGVVGGPYATLADAQAAGAVTLNLGLFINAVVSFTIVAFVVFLLVRTINRLKREEAVAPASPTEQPCPYCLMVVPIKATRCGHCTATLSQPVEAEAPVEAAPAPPPMPPAKP
ncbi:large-conductance mechanosensitive channel protein MscL [Halomonas sp. ATBC28]|uniref:Large-conductance mechanosensitive channel n=1 Tax=Vreelandella neptunia TaxID=115551 RepID=A0ABZ0YMF3_9GAMM|nr:MULTISPECIES: large-conductance mechanosensitive channel protein MscL [Halomonas]MBF58912.1 large conductance mechanosensitive channel protein MscL [Halomonas sp.]MDN3560397.1 large-conductance mechanosensitive channel protein MscL [Halomonas neptunia]TMU28371.1 large-conductance mechanosensitive channel protein MscL [Halomonas sp. ATBC28]UBR51871.1 large-conductance mechanosensitive channel protein MscL [Halomonas sp. FeN2]WQH12679.1 large-conductance mechanosensitive channel protein MscL |tara:strand:- start:464 stop:991 length:528 start_codon:yes stop_codon:yes gene_type:complete